MKITSEVKKGLNEYQIATVKLSYVNEVKAAYRVQIKSSSDAVAHLRDGWEGLEYVESFKVLYLNRANKVLGVFTVATGGTNQTIVDQKVVFTGALLANADSIILSHNHPSGNFLPSTQDERLTKNLVEGAKILGLRVLDHVILTADEHYSFADNGRI